MYYSMLAMEGVGRQLLAKIITDTAPASHYVTRHVIQQGSILGGTKPSFGTTISKTPKGQEFVWEDIKSTAYNTA